MVFIIDLTIRNTDSIHETDPQKSKVSEICYLV